MFKFTSFTLGGQAIVKSKTKFRVRTANSDLNQTRRHYLLYSITNAAQSCYPFAVLRMANGR